MNINGTIVIQSTNDTTDRTAEIQSAVDAGNHIHFAGVAHLTNASSAWKISNCQFSTMGGRGVQMEYTRGIYVISCGFDTVESHAVGTDFSYDISVDSCQFDAVKDVSVFIFKSNGAIISNCCVNGGGSNQGATEADITIGSSTSDTMNTQDVVVQGCKCAKINVRQYTNKTIINNCIVSTSITNTSGTNFKSSGNYVAGSWVANV